MDLNAIPGVAIERIEVLRDGASSQYGSDAIAGVVNIVMKEGEFSPFINTSAGRYFTGGYPDDGTTVTSAVGGVFRSAGAPWDSSGSSWTGSPPIVPGPTPVEDAGTGVTDVVDENGQVVQKRNAVPQPNHLGDGLEQDSLRFANLRMPFNETGTSEFYSFGGFSNRVGTGNGYYRKTTTTGTGRRFIRLASFRNSTASPLTTPRRRSQRRSVGLEFRCWCRVRANHFDYSIRNTLNASLGPCLDLPCAPGADRVLGTADDPGIPNQTSFFAGRVLREELVTGVNVARPVSVGLPAPLNLAFGVAFRRERYAIREGELASYINGFHFDQDSVDVAPAGSSVFPGFTPTDATDRNRTNFGVYADAETDLTPQLLANVAGRLESYSDFGERLTGKVALRYQPSQRVTFRAAASTGFRAPGLSQISFGKVTTNVIAGEFIDVGVFPVDHPVSLALGSRPLEEETAFNFSGGVVVTPVNNLTITADYFHIRINDQILLGATFDDDATLGILSAAGFSTIRESSSSPTASILALRDGYRGQS